jgi:hypothetical protein
MSQSSGDLFFPDSSGCDVRSESCSGTETISGGIGCGADCGEGGHRSETTTVDFSDPDNPELDVSGTTQGGNNIQGGGNCTYELSDDAEPVVEGAGPRCDQLFG